MLRPSNWKTNQPDPFASDNTEVMSFYVNVDNFRLHQPIVASTVVTYTATDFASNVQTCQVTILIPRKISHSFLYHTVFVTYI